MAYCKNPQLRVGICAESTFTATVVSQRAITADFTSDTGFIADARVSVTITSEAVGALEIFSTSFATVNAFSLPFESFWGTVWTGGACPGTLLDTYDHSVTPVRYERLDDITLTYVGDQLSNVERESGDSKALTYDIDGNLITVESDYTGYRKVLSYTTGQLTRVVTEQA